jgi:hypothetical protein
MSDDDSKLSRRELLKAAGIAGVGITMSGIADGRISETEESTQRTASTHPTMIGVKFEPRDVVRLGIVGVGLRGTSTLQEFLAIDKVVVNAVCDVVKDKCVRASQLIEKAGQKTPGIYAHCYAVGMACTSSAFRTEEWKACWNRGSGSIYA